MDFIQELGQVVQKARKEARLTQVQLAELVGVSDKTMRDIERGTGTPSFANIVATIQTLGLELEVKQ